MREKGGGGGKQNGAKTNAEKSRSASRRGEISSYDVKRAVNGREKRIGGTVSRGIPGGETGSHVTSPRSFQTRIKKKRNSREEEEGFIRRRRAKSDRGSQAGGERVAKLEAETKGQHPTNGTCRPGEERKKE